MNRANTLAIWCMFAQILPLFQETTADGTTYNPWATVSRQYADGTVNGNVAGTSKHAEQTAMTIVSTLTQNVNAIALGYIIYISV